MPITKKFLSRQAISDLINIKDKTVFYKIENAINNIDEPYHNEKMNNYEHPTYRNNKVKSWRIIWTKNNDKDQIVLRVLPRKDVYDELDIANLRKRIYEYIQSSIVDFPSFLSSYYRYYPQLSEKQKIIIKKENPDSFLKFNTPEINILGTGNDYILDGGAGTGKTIIAADLAINYLKTAKENSFNAVVYYLLPEKLIDYCKKNPDFHGFIENGTLVFATFQNWLLNLMGFNSSYYIPDWLELGVLKIESQDHNLTIQDLILFQIYVLDNKNQKSKELTSLDHEEKINQLKKIKVIKFLENLKEYFAFYLTVNDLLISKSEKQISSWDKLHALYLTYIKNRPNSQNLEIEKELFWLGKQADKRLKETFIKFRENLDSRKTLSTRIGLLNLSESEIPNLSLDKNHVLIIVDETQDLLEREVVFISQFANQCRKNDIKTNVRYFGDLCQRLYPTGFMWGQIPKHNGDVENLKINYRNSNNVLEFSNQFLKLQNRYVSEKNARKFATEIDYIGISDGEKLRIHVVNDKEEALIFLKSANDQIQNPQYSSSLRKTLTQLPTVLFSSDCKIKNLNSSKYPNLLILEIAKAKGMEFYSNICFCPFIEKEINSQNLMEWYTMFSRTEERLLLVVTKNEKAFLEQNDILISNFNFNHPIKDSIKWINERNQMKLQGLDLAIIKQITRDNLIKGQIYDDIYDILNESGSEVHLWEEFIASELKKLSELKVKQIFDSTQCISFRCLILKTFGNYWHCCKIANTLQDLKERERIIEIVINDLHNKRLHIEAKRVKHFYLNNSNDQFEHIDYDFQLSDVGKIGVPFDEFIISYSFEKITNSVEESIKNHG